MVRGGTFDYLRKNTIRDVIDPNRSNVATYAGFRCAQLAPLVDPEAEPFQFRTDVEVPGRPRRPPEVSCGEGISACDGFDDVGSGWAQRTVLDGTGAQYKYGYHPSGFCHIETKGPSLTAMTFSPRLVPLADVSVSTAVRLDRNLTDDLLDGAAGSFEYGLAIRFPKTTDDQSLRGAPTDPGTGLLFLVDPKNDTWRITIRDESGALTDVQPPERRPVPEDKDAEVALTVTESGGQYLFSIGGTPVYDGPIPGFERGGNNHAGLVVVSGNASVKAHVHFEDFFVETV